MRTVETEEILDALEERAARCVAEEEDDEEFALAELIDVMVPKERVPSDLGPGEPSVDEFTCSSCHLVMARACLADERRLICRDCAEEAHHRLAVHRVSPLHRRVILRTPCPACEEILLVPTHEETACGFFCPGCGVHLQRRGGHLHFVWDHRDAWTVHGRAV